jgi:methanogenic corrinoid protein MtbC1
MNTESSLGRLIAALAEAPPISKEALRELEASRTRLANLAAERIALEFRFRFPEGWRAQEALIRDSAFRFGELLESVYRFGLFPALVAESAWYLSAFSSRGLGADVFMSLVDGWIIAVRGVIKPPEGDELSRPLALLREGIPAVASATSVASEPRGPEAEELLSLLLAGDFAGAERILVSLVTSGWTLGDVLDRALMPCVREIGRKWEHNEIGIASEHAATQIVHRLVARLGTAAGEAPSLGRRALVACVPGEEHELGPSALAAYLEAAGWDVTYLGRSMPAPELVRAVDETRPDVVFLSLTLVANLSAAMEVASGIRALECPARVIFGGRAAVVGKDVLLREADAVARTFSEAHEIARRVPGNHA